ncbi:tyrosine-type recombinase/integrase [Aminobacter niigataensis]|uniref:tyrosine-type recombinase/integrase n=1 Tax=Aminobacter niigataensis TaxID=83265 RepID=UPI0024C7F849|nr:tyrosine-type recombinase/integrase [Aminobacter niigataensis]CAI2934989.1 Site-specific tyrosine recombinase XerD [Aminobacter niigataensis]
MGLKLLRRGQFWYLRGSVCGTHVYRSTKLENRRLADALRVRTEREIAEEHAFGVSATKTFADAAEAYLASGGSGRFLEPLLSRLGKSRLNAITQNDLDAAARELSPNAQPETRNRQCYTPFVAVWNEAVLNDWARSRKWRRPRKPKGTRVVRSVARTGTAPVEYDRAATFVATMSPAPAMLMTALFYTGLRPIELFALEAPDIDIAKRWLVVRSSKIGEPRGVPLHWFLAEWLGPLVTRGGIVFRTHKGQPYPPTQGGGGQLKSAITGARSRSGIMDISPYTARHSVSTQLVVNGIHPHIKDQILGHAVDDMSRRYTNVPQRPMIEAIDTLPVPDAWRGLPWVADPLKWVNRLVEGTGRRTDLERDVSGG